MLAGSSATLGKLWLLPGLSFPIYRKGEMAYECMTTRGIDIQRSKAGKCWVRVPSLPWTRRVGVMSLN